MFYSFLHLCSTRSTHIESIFQAFGFIMFGFCFWWFYATEEKRVRLNTKGSDKGIGLIETSDIWFWEIGFFGVWYSRQKWIICLLFIFLRLYIRLQAVAARAPRKIGVFRWFIFAQPLLRALYIHTCIYIYIHKPRTRKMILAFVVVSLLHYE